MPLSLPKLHDLLLSRGLIPNSYFVMEGTVFYIELFSLKSPDIFYMYIPSNYEFPAPKPGSGTDTFELETINIPYSDDITNDYGQPENRIEDGIQIGNGNEPIEQYLENNYKQDINLKDLTPDELQQMKSIYRQLKRLKYSVQNIKYKLAITYKNYICGIRRDDSINFFAIKKYPRNSGKKLVVVSDLEVFYENPEKMVEDVRRVKSSVEKIFDKNRVINSDIGQRITEKTMKEIPLKIQKKKLDYDKLIQSLEKILSETSSTEERKLKELKEVEDSIPANLNADVSKITQRSRLEQELEKIAELKGEIIQNLILTIEKRDNAILSVDKLMFDNNVMYDAIVKNFSKLKEFC